MTLTSRLYKCVFLAFLAGSGLVACDVLMPPRSQKPGDIQVACKARKWDLGTGQLVDIASNEPKFYFFSALGRRLNERKMARLEQAELPQGVTTSYQDLKGFRLLEFETESPTSESMVLFSTRDRMGLFIAPASCPHLFVEDQCVDEQIVTTVTKEGDLPCFRGASGKITISGDGIPGEEELRLGEVFWIDSRTDKLHLTLSKGEMKIFHGPIVADQYGRATPETLFAVLEHDEDISAYHVFTKLDPRWVTPKLKEELKARRIARIQERLAATEDVLREYRMVALAPEFPGTEEISQILEKKRVHEFNRLLVLPPSGANFWKGTMLIGVTNDEGALKVDEFAAKYGAVIEEGSLSGDPKEVTRIENEFLRRWPQQEGSKKVLERRKKAVAEAQAKAEAERREQAAAERREEAAELARCSARCEHKCMSPIYANKALCRAGCKNVECEENECVGFCQVDCATTAKAGQPGCVSACRRGRCGE